MPDLSAVWVRLAGALFGLCSDIFLAAVYMPPAGSMHLHHRALTERMGAFCASLVEAQAFGHVLVAGDFNATVGALQDFNPSTSAWLETTGLPVHRESFGDSPNLHGRLLTDACMRTGLVLSLGRLKGDCRVKPSFQQGSRHYHFL